MRGFAFAISAVFALAISAPLAALAIAGTTKPYGASVHAAYPSIANLIAGKAGTFDRLGDALRERSPVTPAAIAFKNATLFRNVGVIETSDIIMGRNRWFFYKKDFWGGVCLDPKRLSAALAGIDAMAATAEAAGIEFVFALAPDKSAVYPDKLDPIQAKIWHCKAESSALVDRLLGAEVSPLVNHRPPLLAVRAADDLHPLYWRGDTHWTPYGAAFAVRQLLAAVFPDVPRPPVPRLTGAVSLTRVDMANIMLLLPELEAEEALDGAVEQQLDRYAKADRAPTTVIVHDSFYQHAKDDLLRAFPHAVYVRSDFIADHFDEIRSADRLIVEQVERQLPALGRATLSWQNAVGRAILARNHARAATCTDFRPAAGPVVPLPSGDLPCLRVTAAAGGGGSLEILLPRRDTSGFEPGRSIVEPLPPGRTILAYVLPAFAAGQSIRVNAPPSKLQSIEVGRLAEPSSEKAAGRDSLRQ